MKIAAGATILGLGGLAGFAVSSNGAQNLPAVSTAAAHQKPKVHTQVVRRTTHVRPNPKAGKDPSGSSPAASAAPPPAASAPVIPAPAPSATPVSAPSSQPVSTHSSGGGGGGDDDEGESDEGGERDDD